MVETLNVYMNGVLVGDLHKDGNGALSFQYASSWLASEFARPVSLSLRLRQDPWRGEVVRNFFQNLLPDSLDVRERIERRLGIPSDHPFDVLSAIGRDCVGALQFLPVGMSPEGKGIQGRVLSDSEIEKILGETLLRPLGMQREDSFRISIAGAQEKTALLRWRGRWMLPHGATPTTHILKLPIGVVHANTLDLSTSCENEWLCLEIAKAYGFSCPDAQIVRFAGKKALVVERFDRKVMTDRNILRLPVEDICQALGVSPAMKYEADGGPGIRDIMQILRFSTEKDDVLTFFRAQILFWLLGATDGHAKNFSIYLAADGFRLAPLYDVISVWPLVDAGLLDGHKAKLAMALVGKNRHYRIGEISRRHFIETAQANGISTSAAEDAVHRIASRTKAVVRDVSSRLPANFPKSVSHPIFRRLLGQSAKLC